MKTTITKIKLTLALCLFLLLPLGLFAAPLAYVCGAGNVTLKYSGPYAILSGDRVIWQEVNATGDTPIGTAIEKASAGVAGDADLTLTGGANLVGAGEHFYRVHVLTNTPGGCTGDPSDAVSIYMLPGFTVALTPDLTTYCVSGTTNATKAVVTANAVLEADASLPGDITFVYDWTGSDGGAPKTDDNTKYEMSTVALGAHTVTAKATFNVPAGIPIKTATGVACESSGSTSITVSPTPGKPSITLAP